MLASAQEARADFRVCNGTQSLVGGAIGYRTEEGWAGGGGRWAGDINMCVADNEFRIVGVEDCFARGFQRVGFKEYDTGRQGSWMVQLSDAPEAPESQN